MRTALQNRTKGHFYAMSINRRSLKQVICEIGLEMLKDLNSGTCRVYVF